MWLAKSVLWLPLVNRFAVLNIKGVNTDICEPIVTSLLSTPERKALPLMGDQRELITKQE